MADERRWLRHPDTGGAFHCPVGAVDDWKAMGWQDGEAPKEINPAVAERIPRPPLHTQPKSIKSAPRRESQE